MGGNFYPIEFREMPRTHLQGLQTNSFKRMLRACARTALQRVPRRALSSVGADHSPATSQFKGVAFGLNML